MADRPTHRPAVRPGLDGVRGFAVVVVVAYHLGYLQGGFLGVDLFFVLSGYLITGLAVGEVERSGRLSLRGFWGRRVRRLMPALLVMVAATTTTALVLDWPDDQLDELAWNGISTLTWWNNWYQAQGTSYWAAGENLFRHAWSLSIEEQFYVLWPLAMAAAAALAVRRGRSVALAVGVVAGIGALASGAWQLVLSYRLPPEDLSRVYVGTDTRAVAPLLGCALACLVIGRTGVRWRRALGWVGAAVLGVMCVVADVASPDLYRSGGLLVATAASGALVLAAGVAEPGEPNLMGRAVTARIPQHLGQRSYGIYLWSWPIQVLITFQWPQIARPWLAAITVVTSLVLAEASFRLIEDPLRRRSGWARDARARRPAWTVGGVWAVGSLVAALVLAVPAPAHQEVDTAESAAEALVPPSSTTEGPGGPDDLVDVMITGDSTAWTVGYYRPPPEDWPAGIGSIDSRALIGCGLLASDGYKYPQNGIFVNPGDGACTQQVQAEEIGLSAGPDVVLLFPGAWEWSDVQAPDGTIIAAQSDEMAEVLGVRVHDRIAAANAAGARFVLVAWSCPGAGAADVRSEPDFITWVNDVMESVVDEAVADGANAEFLAPNDQVCVDGDATGAPTAAKDEAMGGEVHVVSVEGGTWIWDAWLGPALAP